MVHSSVGELHTALVDTCNGYQEAIKDTDKPELRALFRRAKVIHEKAHAEIHAFLSTTSGSPDDEGSYMSTVHKTVISLRAATVGLDDGSLSAFASGEETLAEAYDKAIENNGDDHQLCGLLANQKSEVLQLAADMREQAG